MAELYKCTDNSSEGGEIEKKVIWADEYIEIRTEQVDTSRIKTVRLSPALISVMIQEYYYDLNKLWSMLCDSIRYYADRILFSVQHIAHYDETVDSKGRAALQIHDETIMQGENEDPWKVTILTNSEYPYDIEISAKLSLRYERRHYYRIEGYFMKMYFEKYCLEMYMNNKKSVVVQPEKKSKGKAIYKKEPNHMLRAILDELIFDKEQDEIYVKSIELMRLEDFIDSKRRRPPPDEFIEEKDEKVILVSPPVASEAQQEKLQVTNLASTLTDPIPPSLEKYHEISELLDKTGGIVQPSLSIPVTTSRAISASSQQSAPAPTQYKDFQSFITSMSSINREINIRNNLQDMMADNHSIIEKTIQATLEKFEAEKLQKQLLDEQASEFQPLPTRPPLQNRKQLSKEDQILFDMQQALQTKPHIRSKRSLHAIIKFLRSPKCCQLNKYMQYSSLNDLFEIARGCTLVEETVINKKQHEKFVKSLAVSKDEGIMTIYILLNCKASLETIETKQSIDFHVHRVNSLPTATRYADISAFSSSSDPSTEKNESESTTMSPIPEKNHTTKNTHPQPVITTTMSTIGSGDIIGERIFHGEHNYNQNVSFQFIPFRGDVITLCKIPAFLLLRCIGKQGKFVQEYMYWFWKYVKVYLDIERYNRNVVSTSIDHNLQIQLQRKLKQLEMMEGIHDEDDEYIVGEDGRPIRKQRVYTWDLSDDQIETIQPMNVYESARVKTYNTGDIIFHQGSHREYMFIMKQGSATYYRHFPKDIVGLDVIPEFVRTNQITEYDLTQGSSSAKNNHSLIHERSLSTTTPRGTTPSSPRKGIPLSPRKASMKAGGVNSNMSEKQKNAVIDNIELIDGDLLSNDFSFCDSEDHFYAAKLIEMDKEYNELVKSMSHAATPPVVVPSTGGNKPHAATAQQATNSTTTTESNKHKIDEKVTTIKSTEEDEDSKALLLHDRLMKFARYGKHSNTLIANSRCEVVVIPLYEICKSAKVVELLLESAYQKFPFLLYSNEDVIRNYHVHQEWLIARQSFLKQVENDKFDRLCQSDYYLPEESYFNEAILSQKQPGSKEFKNRFSLLLSVHQQDQPGAIVDGHKPTEQSRSPSPPTRPSTATTGTTGIAGVASPPTTARSSSSRSSAPSTSHRKYTKKQMAAKNATLVTVNNMITAQNSTVTNNIIEHFVQLAKDTTTGLGKEIHPGHPNTGTAVSSGTGKTSLHHPGHGEGSLTSAGSSQEGSSTSTSGTTVSGKVTKLMKSFQYPDKFITLLHSLATIEQENNALEMEIDQPPIQHSPPHHAHHTHHHHRHRQHTTHRHHFTVSVGGGSVVDSVGGVGGSGGRKYSSKRLSTSSVSSMGSTGSPTMMMMSPHGIPHRPSSASASATGRMIQYSTGNHHPVEEDRSLSPDQHPPTIPIPLPLPVSSTGKKKSITLQLPPSFIGTTTNTTNTSTFTGTAAVSSRKSSIASMMSEKISEDGQEEEADEEDIMIALAAVAVEEDEKVVEGRVPTMSDGNYHNNHHNNHHPRRTSASSTASSTPPVSQQQQWNRRRAVSIGKITNINDLLLLSPPSSAPTAGLTGGGLFLDTITEPHGGQEEHEMLDATTGTTAIGGGSAAIYKHTNFLQQLLLVNHQEQENIQLKAKDSLNVTKSANDYVQMYRERMTMTPKERFINEFIRHAHL